MKNAPESVGPPAYRSSGETQSQPLPRLRRLVFWCFVVATAVVTYLASAAQKYDAVTAQVGRLQQARELGDPQLLELATRVAFVLAGITSGAILALFLSVCAVIDSRVLPGLRRQFPRVGLVGPASTLGMLSTMPVALWALMLNVNSPKSSPGAFIFLAAATVFVAVCFLRGRWRPLTYWRRGLAILILGLVAALSLVV